MTNIVACYYKDINSSFSRESKELIKLWQKSWANNGWETIILNEKDVFLSPYYDENLWNNTNLVINSNPTCPLYIKACYERWFAYSVLTRENNVIHWADYDVINYGYHYSQINFSEPCRFDPSFCCGVINKETSTKLINNIIKYAKAPEQEFKDLKLTENNDMWLLDRLKVLPLKMICSNPCSDPDYKSANLVHFHGGVSSCIRETDLKNKTRKQIIEIMRPIT